MKTKQKNLRLDDDVIEYIERQSKEDDRSDGKFVSRIIRESMKANKKATRKEST
jgi:hypothetical protein